jgi:type III secretion system FlhB-like substrate exporter
VNRAVAIQYNKELPAPFITAKGRGFLADRLMKIAEKHSIPVVKDDLLSETLYIMDPGQYIPEEVFGIVAEILVFIKETQDLV